MNRRDALKSLSMLAAATGISVTPVTTQDATDVSLVVIRTRKLLSHDQIARLRAAWDLAVTGTELQGRQVMVLNEDISVEFVRAHRTT